MRPNQSTQLWVADSAVCKFRATAGPAGARAMKPIGSPTSQNPTKAAVHLMSLRNLSLIHI